MSKFSNTDPRMLTILLIIFVQILGASMVLPVLPLYAQRRFAMSPELIALLVSSFFAAQFIAGPFIGRLSDLHGRVPVLIVSQIGTVISFLMLAYAQSLEVLFLSRILDGITGGNIVVAQAYITDITPKDQRTRALGLLFAAFGIGFIIGPATGGILSAAFGDQIPFLVAAVAATVTVILTWRILDESVSAEKREANRTKGDGLTPLAVLRNLPLMSVLLMAFGAQFGLGILQATFALYGDAVLFSGYQLFEAGVPGIDLVTQIYPERLVNLGIGLLLATIGLGQFITQIVILPRLSERFNDAALVVIGTLARSVSMFTFAIITTPYLGTIGAVFFALGTGLMMPALQSLATKTVPDEIRGGVLGWYQSSVSLSTIFATALGGVMFGIAPTVPYWVAGAIFLSLAFPAFLLWRREHQGNLNPLDDADAPDLAPQPSVGS